MRKLMILDPDAHYALSLRNALKGCCEVILCDGYTQAAEYIARIMPDYMILDFTSGEFDGFTVLRTAVSYGANPAVIGIIQHSLYFGAMCMKEKNIVATVSRPISHEALAGRITCMMELPTEQLIPVPTRKEFVEFMLTFLGIPIDWEGGKHLLAIIPLAADHPEMKVTKHLYPAAVKETGDPAENVERNIRKAIEHGFNHGSKAAWASYFPADKSGNVQKPSNSVFISFLAEILNRQKEQYRRDD